VLDMAADPGAVGGDLADQVPEEQRADQGVSEFLVVQAGRQLTGFLPVGDDRGEGSPEGSHEALVSLCGLVLGPTASCRSSG
jgi:hypothetical protein